MKNVRVCLEKGEDTSIVIKKLPKNYLCPGVNL